MITPIVGNVYVIHHSSGNVRAKFLSLVKHEGCESKTSLLRSNGCTRYIFLNLRSGQEIVLKSRMKILRLEAD